MVINLHTSASVKSAEIRPLQNIVISQYLDFLCKFDAVFPHVIAFLSNVASKLHVILEWTSFEEEHQVSFWV